MKKQKYFLCLIFAVFLLVFIPSLQALSDDEGVKVIYQTTFSSDPHWITNNPSTNYWDPNRGMYHFSNEPSTGGYAYIPVSYDRGSFTFEYDVNLTRVDSGAIFRFGISGTEMDPSKAPNVITTFDNEKYGQIMGLHLVTPGSKLVELSSQTSSDTGAYNGPTVKYELNKPYHVTVVYDDSQKILSMKVKDWLTGREIWSYYLSTIENLNGMNRIYTGSKGDYDMMGIYAEGFIDNVRLSSPAEVTSAPTDITKIPSVSPLPTKTLTPKITTIAPTPYPTTTPSSPSSGILALAALGLLGTGAIWWGRKSNNKSF